MAAVGATVSLLAGSGWGPALHYGIFRAVASLLPFVLQHLVLFASHYLEIQLLH